MVIEWDSSSRFPLHIFEVDVFQPSWGSKGDTPQCSFRPMLRALSAVPCLCPLARTECKSAGAPLRVEVRCRSSFCDHFTHSISVIGGCVRNSAQNSLPN